MSSRWCDFFLPTFWPFFIGSIWKEKKYYWHPKLPCFFLWNFCLILGFRFSLSFSASTFVRLIIATQVVVLNCKCHLCCVTVVKIEWRENKKKVATWCLVLFRVFCCKVRKLITSIEYPFQKCWKLLKVSWQRISWKVNFLGNGCIWLSLIKFTDYKLTV